MDLKEKVEWLLLFIIPVFSLMYFALGLIVGLLINW